MANKKNFINPLTRSSEDTLNIPNSPTDTSTYTETLSDSTISEEFQSVRKRGNKAFEKTHQRFTGWMEKSSNNNLKTLHKKKVYQRPRL